MKNGIRFSQEANEPFALKGYDHSFQLWLYNHISPSTSGERVRHPDTQSLEHVELMLVISTTPPVGISISNSSWSSFDEAKKELKTGVEIVEHPSSEKYIAAMIAANLAEKIS